MTCSQTCQHSLLIQIGFWLIEWYLCDVGFFCISSHTDHTDMRHYMKCIFQYFCVDITANAIKMCLWFIVVLYFQRVGCDLRIGSSKKVDACGVCGGNGSTCSQPMYQWDMAPMSLCSVTCGGGKHNRIHEMNSKVDYFLFCPSNIQAFVKFKIKWILDCRIGITIQVCNVQWPKAKIVWEKCYAQIAWCA